MAASRRAGTAGQVSGRDAAPAMIAVARRKAARAGHAIDDRVAVVEALPWPDATFDVVVSRVMVHRLPDDLKGPGLAEARRVPKPGGRLVVVDLQRRQGLWAVSRRGCWPAPGDEAASRLSPRRRRRQASPASKPGKRRSPPSDSSAGGPGGGRGPARRAERRARCGEACGSGNIAAVARASGRAGRPRPHSRAGGARVRASSACIPRMGVWTRGDAPSRGRDGGAPGTPTSLRPRSRIGARRAVPPPASPPRVVCAGWRGAEGVPAPRVQHGQHRSLGTVERVFRAREPHDPAARLLAVTAVVLPSGGTP